MILISIIIPVFNGENHISSCLDAILEQSFIDLEIVIVDDGSQDKTAKICRDYALNNKCIKYIHQKNNGVSEARNVGLSLATGRYVLFHDVDDTLYPNVLNLLHDDLTLGIYDIFVTEYILKFKDKDINVCIPSIKNSNDFLIKLLLNKIHGGLWNKIIRRDVIKTILFDRNCSNMEDKLFLVQLLMNERLIDVKNFTFYVYNQFRYTHSIPKLKHSTLSAVYAVNNIISLVSGKVSNKYISIFIAAFIVDIIKNSEFTNVDINLKDQIHYDGQSLFEKILIYLFVHEFKIFIIFYKRLFQFAQKSKLLLLKLIST